MFEKFVHLVGFITRIYHDAWSPERQNSTIHNTEEQQDMSCRHVASHSGAGKISALPGCDSLQRRSMETFVCPIYYTA